MHARSDRKIGVRGGSDKLKGNTGQEPRGG